MTGEDQYALFEFDEATSEVDEDVVPSESISDVQSDGAEEITAQPPRTTVAQPTRRHGRACRWVSRRMSMR
jgi:hypothetical protein